MQTELKIHFRAERDCSGWPEADIVLNHSTVGKLSCDQELSDVVVQVLLQPQSNQLLIHRHGAGKVLEIVSISVHNVPVPMYVVTKNCEFKFNDQCHAGSLYFVPRGTWSWIFDTPIVTWVLDQKILHESQYTQDYKYPWSYSFGPDSVTELGAQLHYVKQKVIEIL